jgi:hypothetical protein
MANPYALAHGLRGFGPNNTTLRVRVERTDGAYAWVRTAALRDAGTGLVLDTNQLELLADEEQPEPAPYAVRNGAVAEWHGEMYRFYCTCAAWPYSPAARGRDARVVLPAKHHTARGRRPRRCACSCFWLCARASR